MARVQVGSDVPVRFLVLGMVFGAVFKRMHGVKGIHMTEVLFFPQPL